jgi:hypothetical protein
MKKTTEPLIDDLLEDSVSPEFRVALLDKTLQSARQRKRMRRFSLVLGTATFVGIIALTFFAMRGPTTVPDQIRESDSSVANSQPSSPLQIVSTKLDSASALVIVQTTETARPKEINDKQFLALLSDKQVALVRQGADKADLIFLNSEDEKGFPVH